jgi:hypothetical protein
MKMSAYEIATDRDFMNMIHWNIRRKTLEPSPFELLLPGGIPSRSEAYDYALHQERKCHQRLLLKMLRAKWRDRQAFTAARSPIFA